MHRQNITYFIDRRQCTFACSPYGMHSTEMDRDNDWASSEKTSVRHTHEHLYESCGIQWRLIFDQSGSTVVRRKSLLSLFFITISTGRQWRQNYIISTSKIRFSISTNKSRVHFSHRWPPQSCWCFLFLSYLPKWRREDVKRDSVVQWTHWINEWNWLNSFTQKSSGHFSRPRTTSLGFVSPDIGENWWIVVRIRILALIQQTSVGHRPVTSPPCLRAIIIFALVETWDYRFSTRWIRIDSTYNTRDGKIVNMSKDRSIRNPSHWKNRFFARLLRAGRFTFNGFAHRMACRYRTRLEYPNFSTYYSGTKRPSLSCFLLTSFSCLFAALSFWIWNFRLCIPIYPLDNKLQINRHTPFQMLLHERNGIS